MKVNFPSTIIEKSKGVTGSEKYLTRLCNNTFLSLWSFPNIFRDQGRSNSKRSTPKGDGKEVCDILVIFDEHVIIFSDKNCTFPNSGDLQVDWSRWYKKAVRDAAKQIWGAERWLFGDPDKLYLDRKCKKAFPFKIPDRDKAIIHRIVVSRGVSKECINKLGGSGSLMIKPQIIGNMHIRSDNHVCLPFAIGQVDPLKGFIHVLDDTTLEIVIQTMNTISDFTMYLNEKEKAILSGKIAMAAGEEEILAYYLKNIDEDGKHAFTIPRNVDSVFLDEGIWSDFLSSPERKAQVAADEISYSWDELINKFIYHITTGTLYSISHPDIQEQERIFRFLARENRTRRRILAQSIHGQIEKTPENSRSTRTLLPSKPSDPYYVFLLLPKQLSEKVTYANYREARVNLLEQYLMITKLQYPDAKDLIGIATETGLPKERSEDFTYLDGRAWTEKDNKIAAKIKKELIDIGALGKKTMFRGKTKEYPINGAEPVIVGMKGSERNKPCPCGSGMKFKKCCGKHTR